MVVAYTVHTGVMPILDYLAAHPDKQGWYPDFPALGMDALFWLNAALIAAAPIAVFSRGKVVGKLIRNE